MRFLFFLLLGFSNFSYAINTDPDVDPFWNIDRLIVVTTADWSAKDAVIRTFERNRSGRWRQQGTKIPAVVGKKGLGWGRGLHPEDIGEEAEPVKKEGDGKAPAGLFSMSRVFGSPRYSPVARLDIRINKNSVCVDDARSQKYNQVLYDPEIASGRPGISHEAMSMLTRRPKGFYGQYNLGIEVNHNKAPVLLGGGSCIFLHIWARPGAPTAGCTAMSKQNLKRLTLWHLGTRESENPIYVLQLPVETYRKWSSFWDLPGLSVYGQ